MIVRYDEKKNKVEIAVIFCKECKYFKPYAQKLNGVSYGECQARHTQDMWGFKANDYCSHAELAASYMEDKANNNC